VLCCQAKTADGRVPEEERTVLERMSPAQFVDQRLRAGNVSRSEPERRSPGIHAFALAGSRLPAVVRIRFLDGGIHERGTSRGNHATVSTTAPEDDASTERLNRNELRRYRG